MLEIMNSLILTIGYVAIGMAIGMCISEARVRFRRRKVAQKEADFTDIINSLIVKAPWRMEIEDSFTRVHTRISDRLTNYYYTRSQVDEQIAALEERLIDKFTPKDKYSQ